MLPLLTVKPDLVADSNSKVADSCAYPLCKYCDPCHKKPVHSRGHITSNVLAFGIWHGTIYLCASSAYHIHGRNTCSSSFITKLCCAYCFLLRYCRLLQCVAVVQIMCRCVLRSFLFHSSSRHGLVLGLNGVLLAHDMIADMVDKWGQGQGLAYS